MAQQAHRCCGLVKIFTWLLSVGEAEGGGDPGDRVKGKGEQDEESRLPTKHAD